jgi:hypothetical protein
MFGASSSADALGPEGEFDPSIEPAPGEFLDGHDVLEDDAHVAFHDVTRELFEERGVYDMTFGYNLADLNRDTRHTSAGYRYAEDADDPDVLRAEFTPTTPFCPQSDTLTKGSFRAWNGLADRHDYDLVRVRVSPMHQRSGDINDALAALEDELRETGELPDEADAGGGPTAPPTRDEVGKSRSTDAPF